MKNSGKAIHKFVENCNVKYKVKTDILGDAQIQVIFGTDDDEYNTMSVERFEELFEIK